MFKNSKQIVPIPIHMLFARNDQYHNYNTRQSRLLHPSVGRDEAIYRWFSFHGVNIWNYLSKHIPVNVTYIRVFSPIREHADNLSLMKKTLFLHSFYEIT